jgi:hypothetical protein
MGMVITQVGTGPYLTIVMYTLLFLGQVTLRKCFVIIYVHETNHTFSVMGPGTPHAVVSLERPGCRPVATVVSGSHCYNRFCMRASLLGSIRHALWHDVWTNSIHDDRDFAIARMVVWQLIKMEAGAALPFQGENLYALLIMAMNAFLLVSVPFSSASEKELAKYWLERYNPSTNLSTSLLSAVREDMSKIAHSIAATLSPPATDEFSAFWTHIRNIFLSEFEHRNQELTNN